MDFQSLSFIFNRALELTFSRHKLFYVFCLLALCGLLVVFFRGLGLHANQWEKLSLTFLPIFICTGILLSTGILLIRVYHDEIKQRDIDYWQILSHSWEVVLGASYFALPLIFGYLLLWILLGIFVVLSEIPVLGEFFGAVLSFGPFIINLGTLVLCVLSLGILFYVAPIIAFKGLEGKAVFQFALARLKKDPFANLTLIFIGLLPLMFMILLLVLAVCLTDSLSIDYRNSLQTIVRWFVIMIPFTAFLTPAVIFFFNFAAEAHVLIHKNQ